MRILTVLTYYRPHWTGLTSTAADVAAGLAGAGHDVTVVTTRHRADLPAEEILDGVRVLRCRPMLRVSRGMITPGLVPTAVGLLASHDVLHLHLPLVEAGPLALAARAAGLRVVATHHGDLILPRGFGNRVVGGVVHASMVAAGHMAHAITAYSDDYAGHSRLLVPFQHKTTSVRPPITVPEPDASAVRAWRAAHGLADVPVIGCAGRWVEEKGLDVLLEAMPLVLAREPRARLVFAGETQVVYERTYARCAPLRRALGDRFVEVGLLRSAHDLAAFYSACDVFALPSRSECLGRTQVEAMLCGTPVVASNVPGARTVVRETGMGLLVPPGDARALAEALLQVLEARRSFARPRAAVEQPYAPETVHGAWARVVTGTAAHTEAPGIEQTGVPPRAGRVDGEVPGPLRPWLAGEIDIAYRRRARRLLGYLDLPRAARVLDCGCGPGLHLQAMAMLSGAHIVGTDGDAPRLAQARALATGASLVRADLRALPFSPGSVDAVLLSEVLEHVDDEGALLADLARVLRPGGVLAISVPHARYPWLWDPINRAWTALGGRPFRSGPLVGIWTNHVRLYTADQLVRVVRQAGFEVEDVEEATHHCLPFHHFLVYGIGKPLLEGGWLPRGIAARLDRTRASAAAPPPWHPLALLRRLLDRIDRRNDDPGVASRGTYVNVLLKARRPAAARHVESPAEIASAAGG